MFLEILQNSQENTCARVSFLIKLQDSGKISKNTFFTEHVSGTASWEEFMIKSAKVISDKALKVSVFGIILVRIFSHLDWMRRDTEYLSVFSPNAGNTDQNNSEYGFFLRSERLSILHEMLQQQKSDD